MDPEPTQIVILRDFELRPTSLTVVEGTKVVLKVAANARGYSQVYAESRPFIFGIEELELETPPLRDTQQFEFVLSKKGSYILQCFTYCKVSMKIEVVEDTSSSDASRKRSSRSASVMSPSNDPRLVGALQPSEAQAFDRYEDFAGLVHSNFNRSEKIPGYLLDCFKNQLEMLSAVNMLEGLEEKNVEQTPKSPIRELNQEEEPQAIDLSPTDEINEDSRIESRKCHTEGSVKSEIVEEESCEQSSKGSKELEYTSLNQLSRTFGEEKTRFLRGKRYFPEKKNTKQDYYTKLLGVLHNRYILATYLQ